MGERKEHIMPKTEKMCGHEMTEMGFDAQSAKKCGHSDLIYVVDAQKVF